MARTMMTGESRRRHDGLVVVKMGASLFHISRPGGKEWVEIDLTPDIIYSVKLFYNETPRAVTYARSLERAEQIAVDTLNGDPGDRVWHSCEDVFLPLPMAVTCASL